jgi:ADP-ribosylglycohydrolase
MKPPLPNSYWVVPGRLLAGEYPGRADDDATPSRLKALFKAGIDAFVDLTVPDELPTYRPLLPAGVRHHAFPLPDHSVPRRPEDMAAIQRTLASELAAGRNVYVHCRAGIGRTGITIGCYLRDSGRTPREALDELNRLWQQNARARHWPSTPETQEQEDFLLAWPGSATISLPPDVGSPVAVPVPGAVLALQPRIRGCVLGLAIGDSLSLPVQGRRKGRFPPVTAPAPDPPNGLPAGTWTDDTAMTLCVLASLTAMGGFDAEDQVRQYSAWIRTGDRSARGEPFGLRPAVQSSIAKAAWRRGAFSGSHDPSRLDPEPLARSAAPALYFAGDLGAAIDAAMDCARVTHQAPLVVDACRLFAAMVHEALSGAAVDGILTVHRRWPATPLKGELVALAEGWGPGGSSTAAAPARGILGCLDRVARTFRDVPGLAAGLLQVVNEGGDADVAGAALGALAGAHHGEAALPPAWRAPLARIDELVAVADELATRQAR